MSSRHLQQMHLKFKHQISESDFLEKSVQDSITNLNNDLWY